MRFGTIEKHCIYNQPQQHKKKLMDNIRPPLPQKPTKFLDQLTFHMRSKNLAYRTEKTYIGWIKDFIIFHNKKHPEKMGTAEINAYLSHLSVTKNLSINSQKTALNAIVYLYKKLLKREIGELNFSYSQRPRNLPTVFSHEEAMTIIDQLEGVKKLAASLMYGSGLRVMESVRLRVKDIDFANRCIIVREAKGMKSRRVLLPKNLIASLKDQQKFVIAQHKHDLALDYGDVYLPNALAIKYPNVSKEIGWQYLFPATNFSKDPATNIKRRHHISEQNIQRAVKRAIT